MICRNCKQKFYFQRGFLDLFSNKKEYLCDMCYKKYPLDLEMTSIPLEEYNCIILSMFKKDYKIDYNYFIKEYNHIFKKFWNQKDYFFLFLDSIDLELDWHLELLNMISKINEKNLFIMTFFIKK